MSIVQPAVIKQIAREIARGNICYIHRFSSKMTIIDDSLEDAKEIAVQNEARAAIEHKIEDYVKIEELTTENQLVIMKYFLDEIPDKSVRKQLSNALNRKNPTRNFLQMVDSDMDLSSHWRNFNYEEHQRWVSNFIIDAYNY